MPRLFTTKRTAVFALVLLGFFLGGLYVGSSRGPEIEKILNISNAETPASVNADFEPFWKVWNTINEKYPNPYKISDQKKIEGAISGLIGSLNDPYSVFFNSDETKEFEEEISGSFTGIGVEVGIRDKILTVIAPLKDTPGYKAGLKPGDKILKIDQIETSSLSIDEAIKLIRGEKGTAVTLTIFQEDDKEPKEFKIIRDTINVPTLDSELRKDGIFVMKLYSFSANSQNLFKKAISEFLKSKSSKLILDLRGNPGGYLSASIDISSWFLPSGKIIVTENYGGNKKDKMHRSLGHNIFTDKMKMIILIDEGSASASEIVAGALHDYKIAELVGEKSYGKGSVQEVVNITPETILKITVAEWLTPNGTSISETGLTPDYKVEITDKDVEAKKDPQMDKAVQLLITNQ